MTIDLKFDKTITTGILVSFLFLQFLVAILYVNSIAGISTDINYTESSYSKKILEKNSYYNKALKDAKREITYYGERDGYIKVDNKSIIVLD